MSRRLKLILAAGIGLAAIMGGAGAAYAMMQADNSAQLRATGKVGEQADDAEIAVGLLASKVQAGQYYRLPDGVWRQREAGQTIALPGYCA